MLFILFVRPVSSALFSVAWEPDKLLMLMTCLFRLNTSVLQLHSGRPGLTSGMESYIAI